MTKPIPSTHRKKNSHDLFLHITTTSRSYSTSSWNRLSVCSKRRTYSETDSIKIVKMILKESIDQPWPERLCRYNARSLWLWRIQDIRSKYWRFTIGTVRHPYRQATRSFKIISSIQKQCLWAQRLRNRRQMPLNVMNIKLANKHSNQKNRDWHAKSRKANFAATFSNSIETNVEVNKYETNFWQAINRRFNLIQMTNWSTNVQIYDRLPSHCPSRNDRRSQSEKYAKLKMAWAITGRHY